MWVTISYHQYSNPLRKFGRYKPNLVKINQAKFTFPALTILTSDQTRSHILYGQKDVHLKYYPSHAVQHVRSFPQMNMQHGWVSGIEHADSVSRLCVCCHYARNSLLDCADLMVRQDVWKW